VFTAGAGLQLELRHRVEDRQPRPDRPLGVVLVRDRSAERRHHCVADELLDRPAETLDLRLRARVVRPAAGHARPPDPADSDAAVKPDEVDKSTGHDLPLLARRDRPRRAARCKPCRSRARSGFSSPQRGQTTVIFEA
jgi:hypothetical protein